MKPILTATILLCAIAATAHAREAQSIAFDAAARDGVPRETVEATVHGKALHCSGVPLLGLLRKSGAMPEKPLHGEALTRIVRVSARDGYRAVFSLAELDPTLGDARVFVVDACNGQPLDDDDGPLRLLVPGEARSARGVRQLQSIDVVDAP